MANNVFGNIKTIVNGFFDSKYSKQENITQTEPIVGEVQDGMFKEQIIAFVQEQFTKRQEERTPYELRWRLTQNFIKGNQYCDINTVSNSIIQQDKLYYWTQREVYNHLAAILETRLAKLGRLRPRMTVRPATSDNEDITSAKVCKSILDSTYQSQKMPKRINEANAWAEICGDVFYKTIWDSQAGQLVGYIQDENGGQQPVFEGDIKTILVPSYEIFPDSCLNDGVEKCKSLIHAKAFTKDEIKEIWNIEVMGKDVDVYSLGTTKLGAGGLGYTATLPTVQNTMKKDSEIVIEYYELPTKLYPKGRLIITAGDELLYYGTCPYKVGENGSTALPFVRQQCVKDSGSFFSTSVLERCIPIQRAYNAVKNRKHEYINRITIGILTYEDGSLADEENIEEDGLAPGSILPRKPGSSPPTFIQNQNTPSSFDTEEESLLQEFREISGVSELSSSSQAPTGVGSGIALEVIKESDDTRISLTAENIREAVLEVAKQWLRLYKQYVSGPRMTRLVGKANEVYLTFWDKDQLTSDDVVAETEDDLAQTPAQRKQQVLTMLQYGLFNDPDTGRLDRATRAKVFDLLNYGNWEDGTSIDQLHINKAMRENIDAQNGIMINVRDFDDHNIHIQEHNKFRLSSDYDDLGHERPDLADYFDQHVNMHQQAIQQQAQQSAMQQAATKPMESMQFKDLPAAGQVQMAQQAGINLTQQDVVQHQAQLAQQQQQQAKITNTNIKGPRLINKQRG